MIVLYIDPELVTLGNRPVLSAYTDEGGFNSYSFIEFFRAVAKHEGLILTVTIDSPLRAELS